MPPLPASSPAAGRELSQLEGEYLGLAAKNAEIAGACAALEAEVGALRDALPQQAEGGAGGEAEADGP